MSSFMNTNYFYKYHVNVHKIDKLGLYNSLQIHSPVYFNFCKFMPVLKPACYKAKATFYVHTFPTGFIEYGQPPSPPIDESTTLIPKNQNKCYRKLWLSKYFQQHYQKCHGNELPIYQMETS